MSTVNYIILKDSTNWAKRFRVPQGTLVVTRTKVQTRERTLTGRADTQEGPQIVGYVLQVRVRNVVSGADPEDELGLTDWGVLADLRTFYALKNPRGSPSSRLTYTDHLGGNHTVEMMGTLEETNITPYLDGDEGWFYITLNLEEVA